MSHLLDELSIDHQLVQLLLSLKLCFETPFQVTMINHLGGRNGISWEKKTSKDTICFPFVASIILLILIPNVSCTEIVHKPGRYSEGMPRCHFLESPIVELTFYTVVVYSDLKY